MTAKKQRLAIYLVLIVAVCGLTACNRGAGVEAGCGGGDGLGGTVDTVAVPTVGTPPILAGGQPRSRLS